MADWGSAADAPLGLAMDAPGIAASDGREGTRWMVVAVLAIALFAANVVWLGFRSVLDDRLVHEVEAELVSTRTATGASLDAWVGSKYEEIGYWAGHQRVVELVDQLLAVERAPEALLAAPAQSELRALLNPVIDAHGYRGIFVVTPDGLSLASTRDQNTGTVNLIAREHPETFARMLEGPTVSSPQVSDVPLPDPDGVLRAGLATMFVGAPVRDADGRVLAVLTFRIDPASEFTPIFGALAAREGREVFAADATGRLLSATGYEDEARAVGLLARDQSGVLGLTLRDPGRPLPGTTVPAPAAGAWPLTEMAASLVRGQDGIDLDGYRNVLGETVVGAWAWHPDLALGYAVEVGRDRAFAAHDAAMLWFNLSGPGALAVVALLGFGYVRAHAADRRRLVALREGQRRLAQVLMDSGDPLLLVSPDLEIVLVNEATSELFGYGPDELLGAPLSTLVPESARDQHDELASGFATGDERTKRMAGVREDLEGVRKDGSVVPLSVTLAKVTATGLEGYVLAQVRDVSDRIASFDRISELSLAVVDKNRRLEEFFWIAAHDLKEPIRKVQAFGDELAAALGEERDPWVGTCLEKVQDGATRLSGLVGAITDYNRAMSRELSTQRCELGEVVVDAVRSLDMLIEEEEGAVTIGALPIADVDRVLMGQVFENLIANGVKFRVPGEPAAVRVHGRVGDDGWVEVVVEDDGIGFDEEYMDELFRPFGRLPTVRGAVEGSGIGLPIAQRIVERHGGTLTAESSPGVGSRFVVRLPPPRGGQRDVSEGGAA